MAAGDTKKNSNPIPTLQFLAVSGTESGQSHGIITHFSDLHNNTITIVWQPLEAICVLMINCYNHKLHYN